MNISERGVPSCIRRANSGLPRTLSGRHFATVEVLCLGKGRVAVSILARPPGIETPPAAPPHGDVPNDSAITTLMFRVVAAADVRVTPQWYYGTVVSNRSRAAIVACLLATLVAACRGPCSPPPPCRLPKTAIANAESGQELGRFARWYAKRDSIGSTLVQPPAAPFSPGGANGTQRAARITGKLAPNEDAFAALVFALDPHAAAALGAPMIGVSFWAKRGSTSSSGRLRVTATTRDATAFRIDAPLYDEWAEYAVPFRALKPAVSSASSTLDPTRIETIEWRVSGAAESYDVLVDEITSFGCIPGAVPFSCLAK